MSNKVKNQRKILDKLGIEQLNPMQIAAQHAVHSRSEVILLSPTGTGKTLAFLLPVVAELDPDIEEVQAMIIAPSRELVIQIEQVTREMGSGFKINSVYGGRNFSKDKTALKHRPAVLIGTPGRVADHLRRGTFTAEHINFLVLDEFDKSLEIGFEEEMSEILAALPNVKKKVLTSATQDAPVPKFVDLDNPEVINFLDGGIDKLSVKLVLSPEKDKLQTLLDLLSNLGNQPGIIFLNFKDSIRRVSGFLRANNIPHGTFYGGMEQKDRERALIKFRNGTHQILLATDLAARGIDVPEIKFIIHYHLPLRAQEFTHRNGRTARMHNEGTAYVLKWTEETLPDFIETKEVFKLTEAEPPQPSPWSTLFVSGGRRDKISKGDLAGLFFKQGDLKRDELGIIELKEDCAFVAVKSDRKEHVIKHTNNARVKKRKVRVEEI